MLNVTVETSVDDTSASVEPETTDTSTAEPETTTETAETETTILYMVTIILIFLDCHKNQRFFRGGHNIFMIISSNLTY